MPEMPTRASTGLSPCARPLIGIIADCTDTYGRAILRGVTRYANLQRRWLLFTDTRRAFDEKTMLPQLDGAIFAGVSWPVFQHGLTRSRHALLCSGGGDPQLCPMVSLDDVAAGRIAAEHLMECGFERFAYYLHPHYEVSERRLRGFRDALEKRSFSCAVCPVDLPTPQQRLEHAHRPAVIEWLRQLPEPIGVLAFDDTHAHDLAAACLEADIAVPDRVAIVGVNNDDLLCECAWPPLSSVEADYTRVGYTAAQVLDRLLAGETLRPAERWIKVAPLGVVKRQSTSTLAIADPQLAAAVRFIRERACDPCSVADVLQVVPVGRRWLERQFVAQLGRTPHDEIVRVRVETAQKLLVRSDLDMFGIAARCGFTDLKSFYQAFRKHLGTTPAAYRRSALMGSAQPGPDR
jgi:LacI family transcriptional regulator